MDGVITKYYMMSLNTEKIKYHIYIRNGKKVDHLEHAHFKLIRFSFKLALFRYYPILKKIDKKNINIIRYVGADFSLLFFNSIKKSLFWELHTNYILELGHHKFFGGLIRKFERVIGRFILGSCKGIISTSNSIFTANKKTYKYNCNYHLLLNSFISYSEGIKISNSMSIIRGDYILIMASNFKFWHHLELLIEGINNLKLKLVILGNTNEMGFNNQNIINFGYSNDNEVLQNLISHAHICIDSLGFDKLNLSETSSLKLFKYLELGGRVATFKNLPFKDDFLTPKYVIKFNSLMEFFQYLKSATFLSVLERTELQNYMRANYGLSKLLNQEYCYVYYEDNRKK